MASLFDGYLIVDWSANSTPKQGKDSIWWCHMAWDNESLIINDDNPSTRNIAINQIRDILREYVLSGKRILVGFDFAYAYPQGFARKLSDSEITSWWNVWQELSRRIEDDEDNQNNRFKVAAGINQALTGTAGPFWGCPESQCREFLSMRKPKKNHYSEFRIAEQGSSAHSVWKLAYPGAVGSQVLMGLPYLHKLRVDPVLQPSSSVWPFETGLKELKPEDLNEQRIIHAEIYPSLIPVYPGKNDIKDQHQVFALAKYFANLDYRQQLGPLFAGSRVLSEHERNIVEKEEGWILGI